MKVHHLLLFSCLKQYSYSKLKRNVSSGKKYKGASAAGPPGDKIGF